MNPFEFVVTIMIIIMVASVVKHRQKLMAQRPPMEADTADQARLRDEVRQLKERVQVLERVITDDRQGADLTREIERLRDR